MKKSFVTMLLISIMSGCTVGPVHVTHKYGHLPDAYVDTGFDNCKMTSDLWNKKHDNAVNQQLRFQCKWKSNIFNNNIR